MMNPHKDKNEDRRPLPWELVDPVLPQMGDIPADPGEPTKQPPKTPDGPNGLTDEWFGGDVRM